MFDEIGTGSFSDGNYKPTEYPLALYFCTPRSEKLSMARSRTLSFALVALSAIMMSLDAAQTEADKSSLDEASKAPSSGPM